MDATARDEVRNLFELLLLDNPFVRPKGNSCPISRLPVELLSRIFEFAVAHNIYFFKILHKYRYVEAAAKVAAGEGGIPYRPSFYTRLVQIAVSHVCRHWRNVAISTPSIWTDIRVSTDSTHPLSDVVSFHLERSKPLLIDITVDETHQAPEEDLFTSANHFYSELIPHIHRWRSLEINGRETQHILGFIDVASEPSSASQLTTLRLYQTTKSFSSRQALTLFNGSPPRLKHVALFSIDIDWTQPWISSASSLTTLELHAYREPFRPTWKQFRTILRGAPALKKLVLQASGPSLSRGRRTAGRHPVQLSQLTDFVLDAHDQDYAVDLLRDLSMPALKVLVLNFRQDFTDFVRELVGPGTSINPSSTEERAPSLLGRIERLAILALPCDMEWMRNMYGELQNLKSLRLSLLDDQCSSLPFLELLLPSQDGGTVMLPRLEHIFISTRPAHLPIIRDVVQERMEVGFPLRSLYLSVHGLYEDEDEDERWFRERLEIFSETEDLNCSRSDQAFAELD